MDVVSCTSQLLAIPIALVQNWRLGARVSQRQPKASCSMQLRVSLCAAKQFKLEASETQFYFQLNFVE